MGSYTVQFPGLGWSFAINSTMFSIGSFEIKWYGFLIGCGFLLAFAYGLWMCKRLGLDRGKIIDTAIVGLIAGIIGARLYYVIFYPGTKYWDNPMEIFAIRDGGLGIYGGIIGGLAAGMIMCKIKKINALAGLDIASLGFLIGQCIGRWGNFVNQEAFGAETSLPWGMMSVRTGNVPVHPCFFYESLWCAIGLVLLHLFTTKLRRYDGQTFLLYVIWYGGGRFFIEALRTDSLYVPGLPIKVSQLVALVSVAAAVALLIVFRKRTKLSGVGSKAVMAQNGITLEGLLKKQEEAEEPKKKRKGKHNPDAEQQAPTEAQANTEDEGTKAKGQK